MSLVDTVLRLNGAKMYDVWVAKEAKDPTSGSKTKTYLYEMSIRAVIQATGSLNTVKGFALSPTTDAGDQVNSDVVMYSKIERHLKDRVLYRNAFYEIRSVELYDNGVMKYYKSYLVRVDNQNDKQNQG